MQPAKLGNMAEAIEEIFRKIMFRREYDGLPCLFFNPFKASRNSAVGSQRELHRRGKKNSKFPNFMKGYFSIAFSGRKLD